MLGIMFQKLISKKWMNLCLLLGSVLLIATVVSFPLYQNAAYDRMLHDEFRNYITSEGKWPTMNTLTTVSKKDKGGKSIAKMEEIVAKLPSQLNVKEKETVSYYTLAPSQASSLWNRDEAEGISVKLGSLTGLPAHAKMLSGEMYSDTGLREDGSIEVVLSQEAMVELKVLVGETFEYTDLKGPDGKKIKFYVSGLFDMADATDFYWVVRPDSMKNVLLMNDKLFHDLFTGENAGKYTINCNFYQQFDYESITASQVNGILAETKYMMEEGSFKTTVSRPDYYNLMETYAAKQGRIAATLQILQIPVLIMLAAFLFMISGQMYDMERNEISVIKSRGSSGTQIFRLYLYQCTFITLLGGALGVPLGTVFSRILGSARNFLEFDNTANLNIVFTQQAAIYTAVSMLVTLLIMTVPAIKHSRVTIVNLKQQKALKKKSWWEKLFLDVILLGVSLYGYYNFHKNADDLAKNVVTGESLDPLLYISSSLFIVGMGLLFLRLQPYIIQLVYLMGKRFWKPASYASFMENLKNGRKQQFIMLFLILTISLGMYHATVARTILQNAQENTAYIDGADVILKEVWTDSSTLSPEHGGAGALTFFEPDLLKYAKMDFAAGYTKVLFDEKAYVPSGKSTRQTVTLMGIHTREFGENTVLPAELNEKSYHTLLNELAVEERGLLVSDNFRTQLGYKVGDTINFNDYYGHSAYGKIVDFFEYWPGYRATQLTVTEDGSTKEVETYQIVTHYGMLRQNWGVTPYEMWISMKEGYDQNDVYQWINDQGVRVKKYVNRQMDMQNTIEDPLLQGTNGVLTMGFMVTIILCAVGYLIYWIMSIKSREMIFGVLRACGMHKGELFQMLMNEQLFSGVFSILAGIGIGKLTSKMFVPMLQMAYAAADQALPMKLITNPNDMLRLYAVIIGVVVVCLAVLIILLFKMNVAKALKLGEE